MWSGRRDSNPRPSPWQGEIGSSRVSRQITFDQVRGGARSGLYCLVLTRTTPLIGNLIGRSDPHRREVMVEVSTSGSIRVPTSVPCPSTSGRGNIATRRPLAFDRRVTPSDRLVPIPDEWRLQTRTSGDGCQPPSSPVDVCFDEAMEMSDGPFRGASSAASLLTGLYEAPRPGRRPPGTSVLA